MGSEKAHSRKNAKQQGPKKTKLEELLALDPQSNTPLEQQYDILTEEEQMRVLQRLVLQNETDIQAFSTFLKMPTAIVLFMNLAFAYSYVTSGMGAFDEARVPVIGIGIHTEHPVLATELSVVILQFTLYLLSSARWDKWTKGGLGGTLVLGIGHAVTCRKSGIFELLWWMLPVLNLLATCFAQLNMRRSRKDIEELAKKTYHVKSA
ncbi:hypothetical protein GGI07_005885 [Coemansia sp. Benny D115]|nr:hypothetical protein GGI07_005885 [Coemansia sp. Benny D115]